MDPWAVAFPPSTLEQTGTDPWAVCPFVPLLSTKQEWIFGPFGFSSRYSRPNRRGFFGGFVFSRYSRPNRHGSLGRLHLFSATLVQTGADERGLRRGARLHFDVGIRTLRLHAAQGQHTLAALSAALNRTGTDPSFFPQLSTEQALSFCHSRPNRHECLGRLHSLPPAQASVCHSLLPRGYVALRTSMLRSNRGAHASQKYRTAWRPAGTHRAIYIYPKARRTSFGSISPFAVELC